MGNEIRAKQDAQKPSSTLWRDEIVPRVLADLHENVRGTVGDVLAQMNDLFDKQVSSFDGKTRTHPYTEGGRSYLAGELNAEASGMAAVLVDSRMKHAR